MTREDFFYQPYFAPFGYTEAPERGLGDEPGRREILRPDVKPLAPGSGGTDPRDPGIGGGGGGGPATCWDKLTERCVNTVQTETRVPTGRLLPVGNFKLGIAASPWSTWSNTPAACGAGRDTIGDNSETTRIAYYRRLKDMGFSEVAVGMGNCLHWEQPPRNVEYYLEDFRSALAGGYHCSEIQIWIPNDICNCLASGYMSEAEFEAILQEINNLCPDGHILGLFLDEPTKDDTAHENCENRLNYFTRVSIDYNIPLILSGYYTVFQDMYFGGTWEAGTLNNTIGVHATGGIAYTGYKSVDLTYVTDQNRPFNGWDAMRKRFEYLKKQNPNFILFPYANPVYNNFNEYLRKAESFERLYLYTGDIFIGNDDNRKLRTLDNAARACCGRITHNCPESSFEGPCAWPGFWKPIDISSSGHTSTQERDFDDDMAYYRWRDCIRRHPEFYGQPECEIIRAYESYLQGGMSSRAERTAAEEISNICQGDRDTYINCYNESRQRFCEEYWTALEMFVQAALEEGWLVREYRIVTNVTTTFCNKRNCDDCDKSNPADWSTKLLRECPKPLRRTPGEDEAWIDPIIG